MRARGLVLGSVALAVACAGPVADPYPFREPLEGTADVVNPIETGDDVRAVVLFLDIRADKPVQLLGAEAVGDLDGQTVDLSLALPIKHGDGSWNIGDVRQPIDGQIVRGDHAEDGENTVGIVGAMRPTEPGIFVVEAVRLRYRVAGGPEAIGEGISVRWTVCVEQPDECGA